MLEAFPRRVVVPLHQMDLRQRVVIDAEAQLHVEFGNGGNPPAERLEQLKKGEAASLSFGGAQTITREGSNAISPQVVEAAFKANRNALPAYAGVKLNDAYAIVRVSKVDVPKLEEAAEKNAQSELGRANGSTELRAYVQALRSDAKVVINEKALEPKANP